MFSFLARMFLLRRLFGAGDGRRSGYGRPHRSHRRGRGGGNFGLFPIPTYSRRTRGGGRVKVGGCCLPIPLALSAMIVAGLRLLVTRR